MLLVTTERYRAFAGLAPPTSSTGNYGLRIRKRDWPMLSVRYAWAVLVLIGSVGDNTLEIFDCKWAVREHFPALLLATRGAGPFVKWAAGHTRPPFTIPQMQSCDVSEPSNSSKNTSRPGQGTNGARKTPGHCESRTA